MELMMLIIGSIVVGVVVGMLSGMLGIGGGTVLVPVFKLLYGMQAIAATATSMFTIIPTSISGVITHVRNKTCIPKLGMAAGIGGAIMSPVGVWLASISPDWAIMVAAALVIGYSAITMFQKAMRLRAKQKDEHGDGGVFTQNAREHTPVPCSSRMIVIGFCIGLAAGVMSGYVGVGGGFLMVPLFMQLLGTPMKMTSGTSLIAVMILAIPGTITQAAFGNVDWIAGIMVAIGSIPGAYVGSKLMKRVPELALRFGFSIFLLVAAALLVLNQLNVF